MTLQEKTNSASNDLIKQFKKRKGNEFVEATRKRKADHSAETDIKPKAKKFRFSGHPQNASTKKPSFFRKDKKNFVKPDWREVRAETKERKKNRKQRSVGGEELFNSFMKAVKLWEELRHSECSKERRLQLCREVATLFIGNVKVWIRQASGIRMAEHLIAYGDADVRQRLFDEVSSKEQILEIIKDSHSHHFLMKILKHGSKDQRRKIFSAIEGQVVKLAKQKFASQVIELAYSDFATAAQRSTIMQEFFGPRFRYFKEEGVKTLSDILEKYPSKKSDVMADLKAGLQTIMHKGIFNNALVLGLLKEYMMHCEDPADFNLVIESLEDGLLPIIHTKDGARIAMMCLWRGTAKQRKTIIKSFKGHMIEVATWDHSYMVLLAALDCVEDTKFLCKAVLDVLMAEKEKLLQSEIGIRVFRYIVLGRNKTYVHPDLLAVLEKGDACCQNKKPKELCRGEILEHMSPKIVEALTVNIPLWCRNSHWTLFVGAAIHILPDSASKQAAMTALAQHCAKDVPAGEKPLMDVAPFSKMLCFLVQKDVENKKNKMPLFTPILIKHAPKTLVSWLKCNRGCFLMVKALETGVGRVVAAARDFVLPYVRVVEKIKSESTGAQLLLQKLKSAEGVQPSDDEEEEEDEKMETESAAEVKDEATDDDDDEDEEAGEDAEEEEGDVEEEEEDDDVEEEEDEDDAEEEEEEDDDEEDDDDVEEEGGEEESGDEADSDEDEEDD